MKRRAFTLVELLIVITIIGILAGMVVAVAAVAGNTGRVAKTRNLVGRIHSLIFEHYNSYQDRRTELRPAILQDLQANAANAGELRQWTQLARLYAAREQVLMEVPDRWSDVALAPVGSPIGQPYYNEQRTPIANVYLRRYVAMVNAGTSPQLIIQNQSAECLYMVVTTACGDGEARSLLHEGDIGDTDGDGAKEFIDGWGRPIHFLRWAPGFNSTITMSVATATPEKIAQDHDPLDLFRVEPNAFRLLPLVFSAGGDEAAGIVTDDTYVTWPHSAMSMRLPPLSPYIVGSPGPDVALGTDAAQGESADNIHNHEVSRRLSAQR